MQESGNQTAFKAFSIVVLVYSIIAAVVAILVCIYAAGSDAASGAASALSMFGIVAAAGIGSAAIVTAGALMLVSAAIDVVVCVFALRCANDPRQKGACVKVCAAALVLSIIGICVSFVQGVPNLVELVSFVFELMILVFAASVQTQRVAA